MDPGEGINGICDDCVAGETERQKRREQMERMVRAVDFTQIRMEELLRLKNVLKSMEKSAVSISLNCWR